MPYSSTKELPPAIKKLPEAAQKMFLAAFNNAYGERGNTEADAFAIAWAVVKKKFKHDGNEWVAKSDAFEQVEFFTFECAPDQELVSHTDDGHLVHTYILTDVLPNMEGKAPSPNLLDQWVQQINSEHFELDTDHELFNHAIETHNGDPELIAQTMSHKKGIAKIISAVNEGGKAIVRVLFDKRYEKFANEIRGLSIEAVCKRTLDGVWKEGKLFGATLALHSTPVNPRAVRYVA